MNEELLLTPREKDKLYLQYEHKLKEALSYSDRHIERANSVLAEAMRVSEEAQLAKAEPLIRKQITREKNEEINKHEIYWRDAVDKAKKDEREKIFEEIEAMMKEVKCADLEGIGLCYLDTHSLLEKWQALKEDK